MTELPNSAVKKSVLTHCKRELMQACWAILLDDEFLEAYLHGVVILCGDGITRRLYPRIFTYSADYPEKLVVISSYVFAHIHFCVSNPESFCVEYVIWEDAPVPVAVSPWHPYLQWGPNQMHFDVKDWNAKMTTRSATRSPWPGNLYMNKVAMLTAKP